jgi:outer membrane protein OmpA-like peptidoglycan-associated protein
MIKQLYTNLEQTSGAMRDTMAQAQTGVTDFQENMEAMKHNFLLRGYFKSRGYEDSAELAKNEIDRLPQAAPTKQFDYSAKQLFDKQDSAKLKNQKSLTAGGEFLANNQFGFAVVVASAGMEGDTQKDLVLTQARAMVVREYLVENFGFDDSQLKTLGMGKLTDANSDAWLGCVCRFSSIRLGPRFLPNKQIHADISSEQPRRSRVQASRNGRPLSPFRLLARPWPAPRHEGASCLVDTMNKLSCISNCFGHALCCIAASAIAQNANPANNAGAERAYSE